MKPSVRASSVDGLRSELKDLRRQVQDLHREQPWSFDPPESGTSAFRALVDSAASAPTFATGVGGYLSMQWTTGDGPFHTSDITGMDTAAGQATLGPAGLWTLTSNVYCTGSPTSGYLSMYINAGSHWSVQANIGAPDFDSGAASMHLGDAFDLAAGDSVGVYVENGLDVTIAIPFGSLTAVQH